MVGLLVFLLLAVSQAQHVVRDEQCITCMAKVEEVQTIFDNSTDVQLILDYLYAECKNESTDPKQFELCKEMAAIKVQIPPAIFDGLESLAWDIPTGVCAFFFQCHVVCCNTSYTPQEVHLSLTGDLKEMGVTWVTLNETKNSVVQYGGTPQTMSMTVYGSQHTYIWGGWLGTIHTATMTGLKPGGTYFYRVGNDLGWSEVFNFTTLTGDPTTPLRMIWLGDMDFGPASDNSVNRMIEEVNNGNVDIVIHVGDISYADGYELHWDVFLNKIQPIASRVPYMVVPGNHEFWFNFTSYKSRFYMPGVSNAGGSGDNMYYSWNINNIHFLAINSETPIDTASINSKEQEWMISDLSAVDRTQYPWIIAYFHRPMYCSGTDNDCTNFAAKLRAQAEDILQQYGVTLVIYGHVHAYERTYPVYQEQLYSTSYVDPKAPVYILNGAAGNREGNDHGWKTTPDWSAFHSGDVGYGHLIANGSSLQWSFYSTNGTLGLEDSMVITKTNINY